MLTAEDFEKLGFWEDSTPEENITIYGMDFAQAYVTLTDVDGRTPVDSKQPLIMAAYDNNSCFLWFAEFKSFAQLQDVCRQAPAESEELFHLLESTSVK